MRDKYAMILTPKNALIDWVNGIDTEDPIEYHTVGDHDTADVFILDEFEDVEEATTWLEENYLTFFEEILKGWVTDEDLWPKQLNWVKFQEFVHFSFQSIVYDLSETGTDFEEINLN